MDQQFFGPIPLPPILSEVDKRHKRYLGNQLASSAGRQASVDQYVRDFANGNSYEDIFNKQRAGIAQMFRDKFEQESQAEIQKVASKYDKPKDLDAAIAGIQSQAVMPPSQPMEPSVDLSYQDSEPTSIRDALGRLGQMGSQMPQYQEPGPARVNKTAAIIAALGAALNPHQAQQILSEPFVAAVAARDARVQEAQRRYMMAREQHDAQLDQLKTELQVALGEQSRQDRQYEARLGMAREDARFAEQVRRDMEQINARNAGAIELEKLRQSGRLDMAAFKTAFDSSADPTLRQIAQNQIRNAAAQEGVTLPEGYFETIQNQNLAARTGLTTAQTADTRSRTNERDILVPARKAKLEAEIDGIIARTGLTAQQAAKVKLEVENYPAEFQARMTEIASRNAKRAHDMATGGKMPKVGDVRKDLEQEKRILESSLNNAQERVLKYISENVAGGPVELSAKIDYENKRIERWKTRLGVVQDALDSMTDEMVGGGGGWANDLKTGLPYRVIKGY